MKDGSSSSPTNQQSIRLRPKNPVGFWKLMSKNQPVQNLLEFKIRLDMFALCFVCSFRFPLRTLYKWTKP